MADKNRIPLPDGLRQSLLVNCVRAGLQGGLRPNEAVSRAYECLDLVEVAEMEVEAQRGLLVFTNALEAMERMVEHGDYRSVGAAVAAIVPMLVDSRDPDVCACGKELAVLLKDKTPAHVDRALADKIVGLMGEARSRMRAN